MSQRIKQSFGQTNIKYLLYWSGMFLFYRFFLNTTLVTLIALICAGLVSIQLVRQVTNTQLIYEDEKHFRSQTAVLRLLHSWLNSFCNTFGRMFRNSGLIDVILVVGTLFGLSKLSFVCEDSTFVFVSGGILLLAPGFNRLLGGSLSQVQKASSINSMIRSPSLESS